MEENHQNLGKDTSFVKFISGIEAEQRKREVLGEYIEQLEIRIGVTDPARNPRYLSRLNFELNMAKLELDSLTESS